MWDRVGDILAVIVMFTGGIDVDEMVEIVGNLYELEGQSKVSFEIQIPYC